ncbi:hypothetical protein EC396_00720 [Lutibacter sp. HS1-25]|uniref:hypothetical protein n=1 Tax=Lutibacter sp. HS1-25 TaxID=2485000 RepID=UPI00101280D9|nr:hypothetical protein [Lutibacter sp. HS1-25]RXP64531.1 hypothetical protein EC396_00720 [Lutibacter sp. HS1-25]
MNKFKLLAIAFVFATTTIFANSISNPGISGDEIRKQIIELVDASNSDFNAPISANITFSFSSEGEIIVLKVESIDKDVLTFIRENVNGKVLANPGKVKKTYEMKITIK